MPSQIQTPCRSDLLCMVKKNSNMLGKTIVEDEETSDVETDPVFWHDIMDVYFIRGRESRGRQEDDLVFFVKKLVHFLSFSPCYRVFRCNLLNLNNSLLKLNYYEDIFWCSICRITGQMKMNL